MSIKLQPIGFRLAVSQTWQFSVPLFNFKTALTRNSFLIRWIKYFCFRNKLYFFDLKFVYEDDIFLVLHFFFFFNFFFKKNFRFLSSNKHKFLVPGAMLRRRRKRLPKINKLLHFRWLLNFLFFRKILSTRTAFLSSLVGQYKRYKQQQFNFFRSFKYNMANSWYSLVLNQPGSYQQSLEYPVIGHLVGTWQWRNGLVKDQGQLFDLRHNSLQGKKFRNRPFTLQKGSILGFGNYQKFFLSKTVDEIRVLRRQKLKKNFYFFKNKNQQLRKSHNNQKRYFNWREMRQNNKIDPRGRQKNLPRLKKKLSWLSLVLPYTLRKRAPYNLNKSFKKVPNLVGSKARFKVAYPKIYYFSAAPKVRKGFFFSESQKRRNLYTFRLRRVKRRMRFQKKIRKNNVSRHQRKLSRKNRQNSFGYYLSLNNKSKSLLKNYPVLGGVPSGFRANYLQRKRYLRPLLLRLRQNSPLLSKNSRLQVRQNRLKTFEKKFSVKKRLIDKNKISRPWRYSTRLMGISRSLVNLQEPKFLSPKSRKKNLYLPKSLRHKKKDFRVKDVSKSTKRLIAIKKSYLRLSSLNVFQSPRVHALHFFRRRKKKVKKMVVPYLFATRHAWLFLMRKQILKKQEFFRHLSSGALKHRRIIFKLQTVLSGFSWAQQQKSKISKSLAQDGLNLKFLFLKRQLLLMLPFQNVQKRLLDFSSLPLSQKQQLLPKISRPHLRSLFRFCGKKELTFRKLWATRTLTLLQRKSLYSLRGKFLTSIVTRRSSGATAFIQRRLLRPYAFGSTRLHDYFQPNLPLFLSKKNLFLLPVFVSWKYLERLRLSRRHEKSFIFSRKSKPLNDRYRKKAFFTIADLGSEDPLLSQNLTYRLCLLRYLSKRRHKNYLRRSKTLWLRHEIMHRKVGRILRYRLILIRLQQYLSKKFLIFCRKRTFFFLQNAAELYWFPLYETKKQRGFNNLHLIGAVRLKNDILMYSGQGFHSRYAFLVYAASYFGHYHVLFQWMQYYLPRVRKLSVTFSHKKMFRFFALGIENLMFSLGLIQGYHFEVLGKIDGSTRPKKFLQGFGIPVRRHDLYASFFYYTLDLSTYAGVLRMRLWILP